MADRLFIFTSKIQGIFRQPIRRVYGRIVSNGHYKTNNVGVKMKPIQRQRWETCFDRREI